MNDSDLPKYQRGPIMYAGLVYFAVACIALALIGAVVVDLMIWAR